MASTKCLEVCPLSVNAEITLVLDRITVLIKFPPLTPDLPPSEQFAACPGVFCVLKGFGVVTVCHNFESVFYILIALAKQEKIFALTYWLALMGPVPVKRAK